MTTFGVERPVTLGRFVRKVVLGMRPWAVGRGGGARVTGVRMPTRGSRPDVGAAPGPQQGRGSGWPGRAGGVEGAWQGQALVARQGQALVARQGGRRGAAWQGQALVARRSGV